MIYRRAYASCIGILLITIGAATLSEPRAQDFTTQSPVRMAPGMNDNETVREIVLADDRGPTDIGKMFSVLGWTTLVVAAIVAVIGLVVLMFVAAERLNRRSRGPVSIFDSPPQRLEPTDVREAIVVTGESPSRRR